jgi:hypothetical protein
MSDHSLGLLNALVDTAISQVETNRLKRPSEEEYIVEDSTKKARVVGICKFFFSS